MHKKTKALQIFYDNQATTFSGTRKRHRPEFDYIVEFIKDICHTKKSIHILEVGCGDGRLLGFLKSKFIDTTITYTGVDISYNLLEIANSNHPDARWVHKDMVTFLQESQPEEYDIIVAVASFHHLPTVQHRIIALDGMYHGLKYEGGYIMTNRCYSNRFNSKYRSEIRSALWENIVTLGYYNKNDIFVPWNDSQGVLISKRLYHIFSTSELDTLGKASGFTDITHFYVDNEGKKTHYEKDGRNLITSMKKKIWEK